MAEDFQQDGFVREFTSKSLAEVNRQIQSAKRSTPEKYRDNYRSVIRTNKKLGGYEWFWVLK